MRCWFGNDPGPVLAVKAYILLLQHSKHQTSTCTKTTLDQRLEFAEKSRRDALELLRHWGSEGVDRMIIAKLTPL